VVWEKIPVYGDVKYVDKDSSNAVAEWVKIAVIE